MATYSASMKSSFGKLGIRTTTRPELEFKTYTKKDFNELKNDYIEKYGYVIGIPRVSDIVHIVPKELKSVAEIKAEKKEALMRILASPAPEWAKKYSSIMTQLDNIQDTASIIFPAISMMARWFPKIGSRIIPVAGWLMLGFDMLNLAVGLGRAPLTGLKGKRLICRSLNRNPFSTEAQFLRKEKIRFYNPGIADLLQVLQVTDQFTGVGLSLGPIMGTAQDLLFGGYRYLKGDRVSIKLDVPNPTWHELMGGQAAKSAAIINSAGQTFSEITHFWSLVLGGIGASLVAPWIRDWDIEEDIPNLNEILIPAPVPTDPLTIEVIQNEGLRVEDGIGWPWTKNREIPLGELWTITQRETYQVYRDFIFRHRYDWYGCVVAHLWGSITPELINCIDSSGEERFEDAPMFRVLYSMVKAPLLPREGTTKEQWASFEKWVLDYKELYNRTPGIMAIKEKFDNLKIPYTETYPATLDEQGERFWGKNPPFFEDDEYS